MCLKNGGFISAGGILAVCLAVSLLTAGSAKGQAQWPGTAVSEDGTPIAYEVFGKGEPALVFVHGWSCGSR